MVPPTPHVRPVSLSFRSGWPSVMLADTTELSELRVNVTFTGASTVYSAAYVTCMLRFANDNVPLHEPNTSTGRQQHNRMTLSSDQANKQCTAAHPAHLPYP